MNIEGQAKRQPYSGDITWYLSGGFFINHEITGDFQCRARICNISTGLCYLAVGQRNLRISGKTPGKTDNSFLKGWKSWRVFENRVLRRIFGQETW